MFGILKKKQKSDLEKIIDKNGIEYAAKRFSEIILQKLPTEKSHTNLYLKRLKLRAKEMTWQEARNSGISPQEYEGSMDNSLPEVDGAGGPQQTLTAICTQLMPNIELIANLRMRVTDNIMKSFSIGKYKKEKPFLPIGKNNSYKITHPFKPKIELQSEEGLNNYFIKLSNINRSDIYIELSNVRAAKNNLMSRPTGINDFQKKQMLVTDLTDKTVAVFIFVFGRNVILGYNNGNLKSFNELVNKFDDEVATLDLDPEDHGEQLLKK